MFRIFFYYQRLIRKLSDKINERHQNEDKAMSNGFTEDHCMLLKEMYTKATDTYIHGRSKDVTQKCSVKKMFLNILQNLQESLSCRYDSVVLSDVSKHKDRVMLQQYKMKESPIICPFCRQPCLSNFSTISQKGADGINEVSRIKNDNFKVTPGMHVQVTCKKNYRTTPGVPRDVSRNKRRVDIFLYGTLMELMESFQRCLL